ncbi:hypothetical protein DXG03_005188 [Asterophora parasitica]|uniref:Uncharacterized protein n=1 Tax=Asterophora parasitica TaxID=117018 RepID=A0A9P7G9P8_9AGAR|nr:hypothetical protein DXG03_005188 [Asterophora parasitica]
MASTLLSSPLYHNQAPPVSPSIQIPNVFIVPPEEEGPAWCCFDANEAPLQLATSPDITFLDSALSMLHTDPRTSFFRDANGPFASHNGVGMPAKSSETRSVLDDLMDSQYPDSDDEMEMYMGMGMEQEVRSGGGRETGNDSEVVEVIKLRRHRRDNEHHPRDSPQKASKSLRSRASKAFRSLRNVGTIRSKRKAQDVFPSNTDSRELPSRSRTPTMSRRSSAVFSQLFSPPPTNSSRSSVSSFDAARSSTQSPPPAYSSPPSHHSHESHPSSRPSLTSPSSMTFDHQDFRSPSPTPSTQTKSNKRRFSMLSLQRMFSFSGDEFSEGIGSPTSMSRDSTGPSTSSSSGPDTPTDESTPHHFASEDYGTPKPAHGATAVPPLAYEQGDVSFEMRLDSLHFESLSFDADRF